MPIPDAPEEKKALALVGRRFVARFEGGRSYGVRLDEHPIPELAAEAAGLLWEETQPDGQYKSPGSVEDAIQALRRFGTFVNETGCTLRIRLIRDITIQDVDQFEIFLREKHGAENYIPYKRMTSFRKFLEVAARHDLIDKAILPRLSYATNGTRGSSGERPKPRDAYSPYVAEQLRQACISEIEDAVERITVAGPRLIAEGGDPATHGWSVHQNIVWAIAKQGLISPTADGQRNLTNLKFSCSYRLRDLIRFVHLNSDDVFSFMTFLSLETGLPIECVGELAADCLRNEARGYVDVEYVKRRRGAMSLATKRVKTDDRNSPGAVIKLILRMTKTAREFAPEDQRKWLFLGYSRKENGSSHLRRIENPNKACAHFLKRHPILDDSGIPLPILTLARLRKTHKAERYLRVNGHLADAADDHTKGVHARHYANIPALLSCHEAAVAAGLQQAMDAAFTPLLLDAENERRLESNPTAMFAEIGISQEQAEAVVNGTSDVWMASCLDYEHSPHSDGNTCKSPVWGCLECKNAVITTSRLPAILAFLNHILERRQQMNLNSWSQRYGRAHQRITVQILPRFPEREVTMARAVAESDGDLMWLPAELALSL
jgi:hypothetical protein